MSTIKQDAIWLFWRLKGKPRLQQVKVLEIALKEAQDEGFRKGL